MNENSLPSSPEPQHRRGSTVIATVIVVVLLLSVTLGIRAAIHHFTRGGSTVYRSYDVTGQPDTVRVDGAAADVYIYLADDGQPSVVYNGPESRGVRIAEDDGRLTVTATDQRSWLQRLLPDAGEEAWITIYLPGGRDIDLTVTTASGDIDAYGVDLGEASLTAVSGDVWSSDSSFAALDCSTTSGELWLSGCDIDRITFSCTSGEAEFFQVRTDQIRGKNVSGGIYLSDVQAAGTVEVGAVSGDVTSYNTDAGDISVKTVSGEVSLSLLSPKALSISTVSGSVNAPASHPEGGACSVSTTSGDIWIGWE